MSPAELARAIDAIDGGDPERAHNELDDLLYEAAPEVVRQAIRGLWGRTAWWATA